MVEERIKELEEDIAYFTKLGFDNLAKKFQRDLNIITTLKEGNTHE